MSNPKYTPPPKFKGQNTDRGIEKEQPKQPKEPVSNQFPAKEYPKDINIKLPYKD